MLFLWFFGVKRQAVTFIGIFFTITLFLYAIFVNLGASVIATATSPLEDVSGYLEIREQYNDSQIISHFPETIPKNATNVKFIFIPGFLQGGTSIQLRFSLPKDDITEILAQYRNDATHIFRGGDTNEHSNQKDGIPTTIFHTNDTNEIAFPDTFEIFVLGAEPLGTPEFEWNHGYSYGVAIDADNSTIVFWAEDW